MNTCNYVVSLTYCPYSHFSCSISCLCYLFSPSRAVAVVSLNLSYCIFYLVPLSPPTLEYYLLFILLEFSLVPSPSGPPILYNSDKVPFQKCFRIVAFGRRF